jgi:diadenosine tetraphosphate (Ap4A) HIT family hydrolase
MIRYANLKMAQANGVAPWDQAVEELCNDHVMVYRDRYPVAQGHLLFVPRENSDEHILVAMGNAWLIGRKMVETGQCQAFNIGINIGEAAGQTVMYPHVHLIPRRQGDCEDPIGGVRGVIAGQANYKKDTYKQP